MLCLCFEAMFLNVLSRDVNNDFSLDMYINFKIFYFLIIKCFFFVFVNRNDGQFLKWLLNNIFFLHKTLGYG